MQRKGAPSGRKGSGSNRPPRGQGGVDPSVRGVHTIGGVRVKTKAASRQRMRRVLQRMVLGAAGLAALILIVYGVTQLAGRTAQPTRLGCVSTDRIEPFGEDLLYYSGTTLSCVNASGGIRWTFQLGTNADFYAADRMVVAWTSNQLYVINASGTSTYNNRMTDTVQFARIGASYVAVFLGTASNGTIQVMNHQGTFVESIAVSNLVMMDIGFFGTRGQRMWTLGLDVLGNAPMTALSTYEPGRLATGAANLSDRLVYRIYPRDSYLMLVDTQSITAYDYKCTQVSSISSALIYGWHYSDSREIGRECYVLLHAMPDDDGTVRMTAMRLLTKSGDAVLRLPTTCFAGALGSRCIYAFSNNAVYYTRYGDGRFSTQGLSFQMDKLICLLDGDRAVVASGLDVFIVQLPRG